MSAPTVEGYVAELDRALRGPRRTKADLVTEARDGLVDAAEALRAGGVEPDEAERRAVREFGPLPEIAAAFQVELGVAQARRSLLIFAAVLAPQPIIWAESRWPWNSGEVDGYYDTALVRVLDVVVERTGGLVMLGTLLALLLCGIGTRWRPARRYAVRVTGWFVLGSVVMFTLIGFALATAGRDNPAIGLLWYVLFLAGPLAIAGTAAHRCLRLAGTVSS